MADEKALIKAAEEASNLMRVVASGAPEAISQIEDAFRKKEKWATIETKVTQLGGANKSYQKMIADAQKTLKPIKGKKGALDKPAKDLEAKITAAQKAVKASESHHGVFDKMVKDIAKGDGELEKKLTDAMKMGKESAAQMATYIITLPDMTAYIEESYFKKGVPPAEIKKALARTVEDIKRVGGEITTAESVVASLKSLTKGKAQVYTAKALGLIDDAEDLAPKLEKDTKSVRDLHRAAVGEIGGYAKRLQAA